MLCILINPLLFNGTLLAPNTVHHTAHIRNEPACTVCTVITSERKGWGWGGVRDFLHAHVEPLLLPYVMKSKRYLPLLEANSW